MKTWAFTLCYAAPEILEQSIDQFYRTKDPAVECIHVLIDQHWPLDYPRTRAKILDLAQRYGCLVVDPGRNLGLHDGFNWAWRQFAIPDNAGVIGYDPDTRPLTQGWDMAMCKVFVARPKAGWISLYNEGARKAANYDWIGERLKIAGHECGILKYPMVNSICMWRQEWMRAEGGIREDREFYGGLEAVMWPGLKAKGYEWVFILDCLEDEFFHHQEPHEYKAWKWGHAHLRTIKCDFGTWVALGMPGYQPWPKSSSG